RSLTVFGKLLSPTNRLSLGSSWIRHRSWALCSCQRGVPSHPMRLIRQVCGLDEPTVSLTQIRPGLRGHFSKLVRSSDCCLLHQDLQPLTHSILLLPAQIISEGASSPAIQRSSSSACQASEIEGASSKSMRTGITSRSLFFPASNP